MTILIIGGAGYIGSHLAMQLTSLKKKVIIFDNFSTSHKDSIKWCDYVEGDSNNEKSLRNVFTNYNIDTVMHLGDHSIVTESVISPDIYYKNNVEGMLNILNCMCQYDVKKIIYSSSAAVYGFVESEMITEEAALKPNNPYGKTKLINETILEDYGYAYGISSVSLRYFNAAGADIEARIGEQHKNETHLIPNILSSISLESSPFTIFGKDYNTKDGTCIRDYIHVLDLCQAHILANEYLQGKIVSAKFNLGSDCGYSILEIVKQCELATNKDIPYIFAKQRPGDIPRLVANSSYARKELGWSPIYSDLRTIIETAWRWHLKKQSL